MREKKLCCRCCGAPITHIDPDQEVIVCPYCQGVNQRPVPYNCNGEIFTNNPDKLSVELHAQEETGFLRYIEDCRNRGLSVDAREDPISYMAYNGEGYKVNLRYYAAKKLLRIDLDVPIDFGPLQWPEGRIGTLIPKPQAELGHTLWAEENTFVMQVYGIGE